MNKNLISKLACDKSLYLYLLMMKGKTFSQTLLLGFGLLLLLAVLALSSCSGGKSQNAGGVNYLRKSSGNNEYYRVPGMVYIPTGAMLVGSNDDGVFGNFFALKNRQITINGFWMDETEVTNEAYRGFVNYVHDSVVAEKLGLYAKVVDSKKNKTKTKKKKPKKTRKAKGRKPVKPAKGVGATPNGAQKVANDKDAPKVDSILDYLAVAPALQDVKNKQKLRDSGIYYYNSVEKRYAANFDNIKYKYYAFSLSKYANATDEKKFSENFLSSNYELKELVVVPDTTVWVKDIAYSYNEPMATRYFSALNYSNYPVVGVSWDQAKAFCAWKTQQTKVQAGNNPKLANLVFDASFRLPTESEWEYAARGGRANSLYPWGGPYTTNKLGCFLANFKNQRGVYMEDGYAYTCDVQNYWPNDFGLYNMAGNVAEWTESLYSMDGYNYFSDINPSLSDIDLSINGNLNAEQRATMSKKKVTKGGSWKDVAAFIQNGYRSSEDKDKPRSYIGFRSVIDLPPSSF